MSSKDYTKFPEGKEGNPYYDALTDAELRRALMSLPETSTSKMTRREKDLYNAGVRRSSKRNKEGKDFQFPVAKTKLELPPKGSSTLSNEPTERKNEKQATAILTSAIKTMKSKAEFRKAAEVYFLKKFGVPLVPKKYLKQITDYQWKKIQDKKKEEEEKKAYELAMEFNKFALRGQVENQRFRPDY